MTRRENFLAALRKQPHEYVPAVFPIDTMNFPGPFPTDLFDVQRWADVPHTAAFQRRLGLDVLWCAAPSGVREAGASSYWRDDPSGGRICETPVGVLHEGAAARPGEPTACFGKEWTLKGPKDYETLTWLFEHWKLELVAGDVETCRGQMREIGEDGILYVPLPSSAIMDLVRSWAGIEAFAYALCDFSEKVENLIAAAGESYRRMYELTCASTPAEVVVLWDDATTRLLSRSMFEKYSAPNLKQYARAAHNHGKILINHTCGPIRGFADLYVAAEQDAVDWLALPPTGDMTPAAVKELWGGKVTPMYAPDPQTVRFASPDSLHRYMEEMLGGADLSGAVVLVPCPPCTPLENARVLARFLAERCGTRWGGDLLQ